MEGTQTALTLISKAREKIKIFIEVNDLPADHYLHDAETFLADAVDKLAGST